MKVGDLVRWLEELDCLGIVLKMDVDGYSEVVRCLLVEDSSICIFLREELEVVCK